MFQGHHQIIKDCIIILSLIFYLPMQAQTLSQHQWKNRIIVVKSNSSKASIYQSQLKEFNDSVKEMAERKLVLYTYTPHICEFTDFAHPNTTKIVELQTGNRKLLSGKKAFEVILIGLDGGVKLHQSRLLTKEKLFNTIDAMPMRRAEMRNNE